MSRYKLFRLMGTLDKKEMNRAEQRIASKNPGQVSHSLKLFRDIKKGTPHTKEGVEKKQYLFSEVFPDQPYDDNKMRKLMTGLTRELEDFLIQKELENDFTKKGLLVKALSHRSDYKLFMEAVENRLKALDKQEKRGLAYFREKYQLLQSIYYHPETAKFTTKNDYFQEAAFYQECYFVLGSLMTGAEGLSRVRAIKSTDKFHLLEVAIKIANNMADKCPAVILLFKNLVGLLREKNQKADLKKLKEQLSSAFDRMAAEEQRMALKLLIVFATPHSNKGEKEYTRFIFDIYRMGIDHQLLKNGDNPIEALLFLNIAITGATVGELDWTNCFIKKYHSELATEDQLHAYNLCMATWHYKRGMIGNKMNDLREALRLLNFIPTRSEEILDLRARSLSLRIYFDLFARGEAAYDVVHENARNFERHLANNSTYSTRKINAYLAFIRHCRKLAKLQNGVEKNEKAIKSFLKSLRADKTCVIKQWLLEKAEEVLPPSAFEG